jgi:methyl-accepting chemotaxis protein
MQQLDQVTQTNAAASEELAATSQEMRTQSQSLLEMIGFFKITGQELATEPTRSQVGAGSVKRGSTSKPLVDSSATPIDESQFERF